MAVCRHTRRGIVTNQLGPFDPNRPHAAASCCARIDCIRATGQWVSGKTGETAYWIPDRDRTLVVQISTMNEGDQ